VRPSRLVPLLTLHFGLVALALLPAAECQAAKYVVTPPQLKLQRNFAQAQLLVRAVEDGGQPNDRSKDLTHEATYTSSDPSVVSISDTGRLLAGKDGQAVITITAVGEKTKVPVEVTGVEDHPKIGFSEFVAPILSKAGCNAGACHASQYGKGGFKLSVFSFAPEEDWQNMIRDRQGRRVNMLEPENSLILLKPTLAIPHGGNRRLQTGSVDYDILKAWLAGGAPAPQKTAAKVTRIQVTPSQRVGEEGLDQQLQVIATYSDDRVRDVTAWAKFDSMDDSIVTVTPEGLAHTVGRGQASVMVRFEGQAEISMIVVPYSQATELAGWKDNNFVDTLAAAKFKELGIEPSALCDDATFLRRAYLDAIGSTPSVEETKTFIDSTDPDKRKKLIDRLLGLTGDPAQDTHNNEYAAYWSIKWSDLIRSSSNNLGEQGMWSMHNWIKDSLRENKPFDQFVRELIAATGSIYKNGPANYYRIAKNPLDLSESTAQLFLGVRLQCAKCHHHPFEKYSQDDYYSFASFFARVGTKPSQEFGLFGGEQVVLVKSTGDVKHPRTNQILPPTPLDGKPVDDPLDRRRPLATWLTAKENPFFAKSIVNRYMGYLMGRGLVEPVDDMRATNPPTNPPLMDALAKDFTDSGFNLKHLMRSIMNSRLYQLDSQPTKDNVADSRFYSHYQVKRLSAEPLLDAIDQVTGVQTKFKNLPIGTRAIELPDAEYPDYFLKTFGKPKRVSVCECERTPDENLAQALHTLNGDLVADKISGKSGRVADLLKAKKPHQEIVSELYLAALSRRPTPEEFEACQKFLEESPSPQEFYEDLLWTLINSKQFLYVY
jgi:hypothetical protein